MSKIVSIGSHQVELLREVAIETYQSTFGPYMNQEDLKTYFNSDLSLARLKKELENPDSQHYFLLVGEEIAGFLKLNQGLAQTEQELPNAFEIQRIYLKQAYQGLGFGKILFDFAMEKALASNCDWVWLGVWEHNIRAQAFYQKYGFERFGQHEFVTGNKIDTDWLLRKPLERKEKHVSKL